MKLLQKRVYDHILETDGQRILFDRLWPRGLSKQVAQIDLWPKVLTPSNALRKWYHEDPEQRWDEFQQRYLLKLAEQKIAFEELQAFIAQEEIVTFLTASKNTEQNHVTVLIALLSGNIN